MFDLDILLFIIRMWITIVSYVDTSPHLTRWNHIHFGVGVVGITQKKVWAAGSPLNERWNRVRAFEESLRRRCGPTAHRSKDSEIECGPSAHTEWTVKSRWNTLYPCFFEVLWLWKLLCSLSDTILSGSTRLILLHPPHLNTTHCVTTP